MVRPTTAWALARRWYQSKVPLPRKADPTLVDDRPRFLRFDEKGVFRFVLEQLAQDAQRAGKGGPGGGEGGSYRAVLSLSAVVVLFLGCNSVLCFS